MAMNLVLPHYPYHLQMSGLQWPCIKARTKSGHKDHRLRPAAAQSTEQLQGPRNPNGCKSNSMRKQNMLPQWTQTTLLALILMSIKSVCGYEEQNQSNTEKKICNKRNTVQKIQTSEKQEKKIFLYMISFFLCFLNHLWVCNFDSSWIRYTHWNWHGVTVICWSGLEWHGGSDQKH